VVGVIGLSAVDIAVELKRRIADSSLLDKSDSGFNPSPFMFISFYDCTVIVGKACYTNLKVLYIEVD
jgi:hypothetical protein